MSRIIPVRMGAGLLRTFASLNYKSWFAFGEFIDNSVQSYDIHREALRAIHGDEFKLRIDIEFSSAANGASTILIKDNAGGIAEEAVTRAFDLGIPPDDRTRLSQYGIGMKTAAAWYSRRFIIDSTALGESVRRRVTYDVVELEKLESLGVPLEEELAGVNESFTRIMLHNLNQPIPSSQTLVKVRSYLRSMYREWLRSGDVVISVAGEELAFTPPRPLREPYWETPAGPSEGAEARTWVMPFQFSLDESWESDTQEGRPATAPVVRGQMQILERGKRSQAGLALLWRRKVVVGNGMTADSPEDTYRPPALFGAPNSYQSLRLYGEVDVSQLQVTTFKDAVNWRAGQEDEFTRKLLAALQSGGEPMMRMVLNFRATERSPDVTREIRETVERTATATEHTIGSSLDEFLAVDPPEVVEPRDSENSPRVTTRVRLPGSLGYNLYLEVKDQPGDTDWLRLVRNDEQIGIVLNRSHPFMASFAPDSGVDVEPLLRLATAIALAELRVARTGLGPAHLFRLNINDLLRSALAHRILPDEVYGSPK